MPTTCNAPQRQGPMALPKLPADPAHERNQKHQPRQKAVDLYRQKSALRRYYPRRETVSHQNSKVAIHGYHQHAMVHKSPLAVPDSINILETFSGGARLIRPVLLQRRKAIPVPQTTFCLERHETGLLAGDCTIFTSISISREIPLCPLLISHRERLGSIPIMEHRHHCDPQACGTKWGNRDRSNHRLLYSLGRDVLHPTPRQPLYSYLVPLLNSMKVKHAGCNIQ